MLFETALWALALVTLLSTWHLLVIRGWRRKLDHLQQERLRYTGETPWRS